MILQKTLIGKNYDREIFEDGFRRAARAITAETQSDPNSPTGLALQEVFVNRMRTGLEKMPVEYYQLLERFAGKEPIGTLAEGEFVERWKDAGDVRLVKLMMEMTEEFGDKELKITDPEASRTYHARKFPQRTRLKLGLKKEKKKEKISVKEKRNTKEKKLGLEK